MAVAGEVPWRRKCSRLEVAHVIFVAPEACAYAVMSCATTLARKTKPVAKIFVQLWQNIFSKSDFGILRFLSRSQMMRRTFTGLLVGYSLAGAFSATTLGGYNIAKRWNGMPIYASNKGAKSGSDLQKRIYHEKWNTLWQLTKHLVPFIPCCRVQYPKIASVKTRCLDIGLCILYNTKTHNKNDQEPNGPLSR